MILYLARTYDDFVQVMRGWGYREPQHGLEHSQWLAPAETELRQLGKL